MKLLHTCWGGGGQGNDEIIARILSSVIPNTPTFLACLNLCVCVCVRVHVCAYACMYMFLC